MSSFADALRRQREAQESELASAEKEAISAGREPFDFARLSALLHAAPDTYAKHERSLRESYYILETRLKTMEELAEHVREMTVWGFWEVD